jgi:hypothetical protein
MSYGLEIYNSNGSLTLSSNSRMSRIHATYSYSLASNSSQDITVTGLSLDGTWAITVVSTSDRIPVVVKQVNNLHITNYWAIALSGEITVFRY